MKITREKTAGKAAIFTCNLERPENYYASIHHSAVYWFSAVEWVSMKSRTFSYAEVNKSVQTMASAHLHWDR